MIDEKKLSKDICNYLFERIKNTSISKLSRKRNEQLVKMRNDIIDIINAQPQADKWITCSVSMPPVETEVFILAKRKFKCGDCRYIRTTAMYEDGTVLENDSCWRWEDIAGEWDEENDCYIIPKGWWENRHYNPDDVYNNAIDDEVIAWQLLPEPYREGDTPCT